MKKLNRLNLGPAILVFFFGTALMILACFLGASFSHAQVGVSTNSGKFEISAPSTLLYNGTVRNSTVIHTCYGVSFSYCTRLSEYDKQVIIATYMLQGQANCIGLRDKCKVCVPVKISQMPGESWGCGK